MWSLEGWHSPREPLPTPIHTRRTCSHLGGESRSRSGTSPPSHSLDSCRFSPHSPEQHVPRSGCATLEGALHLLGFLPLFKSFRADDKLSSAFQRGKPDAEGEKHPEDWLKPLWASGPSSAPTGTWLLWAVCTSGWRSCGLYLLWSLGCPGVARSMGAGVEELVPSSPGNVLVGHNVQGYGRGLRFSKHRQEHVNPAKNLSGRRGRHQATLQGFLHAQGSTPAMASIGVGEAAQR